MKLDSWIDTLTHNFIDTNWKDCLLSFWKMILLPEKPENLVLQIMIVEEFIFSKFLLRETFLEQFRMVSADIGSLFSAILFVCHRKEPRKMLERMISCEKFHKTFSVTWDETSLLLRIFVIMVILIQIILFFLWSRIKIKFNWHHLLYLYWI